MNQLNKITVTDIKELFTVFSPKGNISLKVVLINFSTAFVSGIQVLCFVTFTLFCLQINIILDDMHWKLHKMSNHF